MSLQIAAKHLATKGRGPDTTLVHMTNKEVQGLQALAEKNGGSLSINPDTGLPEAGFLESILPLVAGVGLAAAGMPAGYAALTVGGVTALSTGNLSKGLYAGLGAYGGASLGQQLAVQGMSAEAAANASFGDKLANMGQNASFENIGNFISANPKTAMAGLAGPLLSSMEDEKENDKPAEPVKDTDPGARARSGIKFNPGYMTPTPLPNPYGIEQTYATPYYAAEGGVTHMAEGGMAYGGSTSGSIDTKSQFADYLNKVMNPTNRTNAISGSTNPYEWWKSPSTPEAAPAAPAETAEEYAARTRVNTRSGGGGPSAEEREAQLNEVNDYLSTPENPITMNQYFAMSSDDRKALDAAAAERNPIRGAIKTGVETFGVPVAFRAIQSMYDSFTGSKNSTGGPSRYTSTATQATPAVTTPNINPVDPYAVDADYGMDKNITYTAKEQARIDRDEAVRSLQMAIERESPDSIAKYQAQVNDLNSKLAALNGESTAVTVPNINPVDPYAVDSDYVNTLAPASDAVAQTNAALTPAAYPFKPNAIQDALDNSKMDVIEYPEKFNDLADRYLFANKINRVTTEDARNAAVQRAADEAKNDANMKAYTPAAYPFQPDAVRNMLANSALPESNKILNKYLADNANIAPIYSADLSAPTKAKLAAAYAKENQAFNDRQNAILSANFNKVAETPMLREQLNRLNLQSQTDAENNAERGDRFAPLPFAPIAAPDIVGTNEISAAPDDITLSQFINAFAINNSDTGYIGAPIGTYAMNTDGTVSDAGNGLGVAGVPAPNMGRASSGLAGISASFGGLGSAWQGVVDRNGNPVLTSQGAAENAFNASPEGIAAENAREMQSLLGRYRAPAQDPAQQQQAAEAAERAAQTAQDARADRESQGGSRDGGGGVSRSDFGGGARDPAGRDSSGAPNARGGLIHPYANGGLSAMANPYDLGSYSDGGRLLRGPGDGVSDSIPATIGKGRPARLADGEFVIPARIVSEIGNGSTEAGARKLYAMMDRIQASRRNTVGKGKVAVNNRAYKHLPA